jgi:hypothetical protein
VEYTDFLGRFGNPVPALASVPRDWVVERRLSYEEALERFFPRLLAAYGGDRSRIFSFDAIDERYI